MKIEFKNYEEMYDKVSNFRCGEAKNYIPEGKEIKLVELANNGDYRNDVFGFRLVVPKKNLSFRLGRLYSFSDGQWNEESWEEIVAIYELDEKDPRNAIEAYANVELSTLIEAFPDVEPDPAYKDIAGYIDTEEFVF